MTTQSKYEANSPQNANANKAINIVFVCYRPAVWGALKSVFESCLQDSEFNVSIVAIPRKKQLPKLGLSHEIYETEGAEEFFKDFPCRVINGYNYRTNEWFDLESLNPHYVFFQQPYNITLPKEYSSKQVSRYAKILFVHYAANILGNGILEDTLPQDFVEDIYIYFATDEYDKKLVEAYFSTINTKAKVHLSGYPKYDGLEKYKNTDSTNWNLSRKDEVKRVIWTPRWNTEEGNCHFFEYKDKLLDYVENHTDIDFIFRPHPQAFLNLNATGELPEQEAEKYKNRYEKLPNAKIDTQKEYLSTFYTSSFMITDISSIIGDYFLTGKPIIYCHKTDYFNEFSHKLAEGFYWVHNWQELQNTIEMLKSGKDPLKEKRQEIIKNEFYLPKEGAGYRIKEWIKKDFYTKLKISFCVTYYNQAQYIDQSIKSILSLKMPCDFEILIGDDGSTDDTLAKLKEWQKQYPKNIQIFVMPREQDIAYNAIHRASANRLNLIKNATGDYVMFLDGDDFYCDRDFVGEALEQFKQHNNLIACAFNFAYFYPKDNFSKVFKQDLQTGFIDIDNTYIPRGGYIHCGAIMFRNIFDKAKIALCEKSKNFDDNLISIYLFSFGEVYFINKPIYAYRQTDESIWNSMQEFEQHLLNAMDYEIISRVAPNSKKALAKRQFSAIKQVFKNKTKAFVLLGKEKFDKYVKENTELKNDFILNLLLWRKLSFLQKLKTLKAYSKIRKFCKAFDHTLDRKYKKYKRLFKVFFGLSLLLAVALLALIIKGA